MRPEEKDRVVHAVAGAMARLTEGVLMFPLDIAKTRLQFQSRRLADVKAYNGVFSALYSITKDEGMKGLTRGMLPKFVYIIPAAAVSFLCYEEILREVRMWSASRAVAAASPEPGISPPTFMSTVGRVALPVLGMMSARIMGSLCRTPFDIVKQRMQVQGSLRKVEFSNSKKLFLSILRTEGPRSLFAYAHLSLLRDIPFSAFYFSSYELFKMTQANLLEKHHHSLGSLNHFVAGGLAGMVATTVTIPLDVIKTKLQTQAALPPQDRIYKGAIHAMKDIVQKEGLVGLTRGLSARVIYLAPASAIVFTTYEQYKRMLTKML